MKERCHVHCGRGPQSPGSWFKSSLLSVGPVPGESRFGQQLVTSERSQLPNRAESLAELWLTRSPDCKATTGAPSAGLPEPQVQAPENSEGDAGKSGATSWKAFLC